MVPSREKATWKSVHFKQCDWYPSVVWHPAYTIMPYVIPNDRSVWTLRRRKGSLTLILMVLSTVSTLLERPARAFSTIKLIKTIYEPDANSPAVSRLFFHYFPIFWAEKDALLLANNYLRFIRKLLFPTSHSVILIHSILHVCQGSNASRQMGYSARDFCQIAILL